MDQVLLQTYSGVVNERKVQGFKNAEGIHEFRLFLRGAFGGKFSKRKKTQSCIPESPVDEVDSFKIQSKHVNKCDELCAPRMFNLPAAYIRYNP